MKNNEVCILGMFRSGTNYTKALIELNFDCSVKYDSFGWKHAFFPLISPNSEIEYPSKNIVSVTRNPFLALHSLYNYAVKNGRNLRCHTTGGITAFLRNPIVIFDESNKQSPEYFFATPIDYWLSMNWNLVSVTKNRKRAFHLKYEEIIAQPEQKMKELGKFFALATKDKEFISVENRLRNLSNHQHEQEKFFLKSKFDVSKVTPQVYMQAFSILDVEFMSCRLPRQALEYIGYTDLQSLKQHASLR